MKPIEIPVTCACYNYSCIRETHVSSLELTWNRYYSYWGERLIREELDYRSLDVKTTLEFQLSFFFFNHICNRSPRVEKGFEQSNNGVEASI